MTSRFRLLWTLAALAVVCAALLVTADRIRQPPAIAAENCQPAPGDHMLGTALLHVPPHPRPPLALVLAFHGSGGSGPGFALESHLSHTSDKYGFAVLYPTAGSTRHFWSLNASMQPDDVAAVKALLPVAMQAACANPSRIYATGVSNGGGFAARLGCDLAGTIAAVAPVAGGYRALDPCPDGRQTSVLEIHGTSDGVVPYGGAPPDYKGSVSNFLAGWIRRDRCGAKPVESSPEKGVTRYSHPDCADGLAVEHLRLTGTDHGWPGADPPWPKHNPSQLEANEEVWGFFAKHQLVRSASAGESRAARSAG
jgi:polyhydroxybutyrate depolymerase